MPKRIANDREAGPIIVVGSGYPGRAGPCGSARRGWDAAVLRMGASSAGFRLLPPSLRPGMTPRDTGNDCGSEAVRREQAWLHTR